MNDVCNYLGVPARYAIHQIPGFRGYRIRSGTGGSPRILFVEGQDERQQQGSRESSSTGSTFATRGEGGGAERRERMGVTALIEAAMGGMRVSASRKAQQLRERMRWLGDEAKRWLWRDAG